MGFGNKKEKEATTNEALIKLVKEVQSIGSRIEKLENKATQSDKIATQPQPEQKPVKPETKKEITENYIIKDIPTQTQPMIVNIEDPQKPIVYDTQEALAKILNEMRKLGKVLS